MAIDAGLLAELARVPAFRTGLRSAVGSEVLEQATVHGKTPKTTWLPGPPEQPGGGRYARVNPCDRALPFQEQEEIDLDPFDRADIEYDVHEISLGFAAGFTFHVDGVEVGLWASLPKPFGRPTVDRDEVFDALAGEWNTMRTMTIAEAADRVGSVSRDAAGLFFPDGFVRSVVELAIVTLHSWAELAEMPDASDRADSTGCQFSLLGLGPLCTGEGDRLTATRIRRYIDDRLNVSISESSGACSSVACTIEIDPGLGTVGGGRATTTTSWYDDSTDAIVVCDAVRFEAGLADYYLWWSWRLWDYYLRCGSWQHGVMAWFTRVGCYTNLAEVPAPGGVCEAPEALADVHFDVLREAIDRCDEDAVFVGNFAECEAVDPTPFGYIASCSREPTAERGP